MDVYSGSHDRVLGMTMNRKWRPKLPEKMVVIQIASTTLLIIKLNEEQRQHIMMQSWVMVSPRSSSSSA